MKRVGWVLFGAAVGALVIAERLRPLRRRVDPGPERIGRNLAIGALAAATTATGATAIVAPVQRWAERRRVGLLQVLGLPRPMRLVGGFLLLDYTLFLWHWLNHRSPLLWRFHVVHHVDLDLDTTTGIRFHFGELALSVALRAWQIVALGVEPEALQVWSRLLFLSVLFHHSNVDVSSGWDARLAWIVTTPRMHGIHHSARAGETNSNYSSLLSWWDHLHGVFRADVPQHRITIGAPGIRERIPMTVGEALALPFARALLRPPVVPRGESARVR